MLWRVQLVVIAFALVGGGLVSTLGWRSLVLLRCCLGNHATVLEISYVVFTQCVFEVVARNMKKITMFTYKFKL